MAIAMAAPQEEHDETRRQRVNRELIELLNELRIALPGVQVLFAFLLAVPFSNGYSRTTDFQRAVFLVTLIATAVSAAFFIAQAESGLMAITGDDEPTKVGVAIVDVMTGIHAATAILAALHGGGPRRIEVSLLDTGLASLINVASAALVTGDEPRRYGNAHPHIVPYQPFRTSDGWVAVAAANDGLFRRMCDVLEQPGLAERFPTNASRVEERETLIAELESVFATRTADDWTAALDGAGVPAGKIRGVLEAIEAATAAGDDPTVRIAHPTAGEVPLVRSPIRMDGAREPEAPPLLGQHTREVLAELGVSETELRDLAARGAIEANKT